MTYYLIQMTKRHMVISVGWQTKFVVFLYETEKINRHVFALCSKGERDDLLLGFDGAHLRHPLWGFPQHRGC